MTLPTAPRLALFATTLFLLSGCGSSDETTATTSLPCSAEAAATCAIDQMACSADAAGAPQCAVCPRGEYSLAGAACEPIQGSVMSHDFADFTTAPGEEVLGQCQSWTLNNAEDLWVSVVELYQDEASHHSNWTFAPSNMFDGPDGVWKCKDRGYSQVSAALSGGVLYAQSTQAEKEVQRFPNGAAVRIPAYSRIIGDVHLLNTTAEAKTGHASLSIYAIPESEVQVKLVPFHLTFETLDIPAKSRSRFEADCDLTAAAGGPLDMSVYYALPHTHALGVRNYFGPVGGPLDGQLLMDVAGFNSEARGIMYDPPPAVDGATGLRFGCEFDNPRDEAVHWGFDDQEMCEMLGFSDASFVFEASVNVLDEPGTADGMPRYTGKCDILAVPWDHTKPGGPPPN